MPQRGEQIGDVFQALADPTRRQVVEQLTTGPAATSVLAEPFDMALPSFIQHLSVLERAGVVTSTKPGRTRTYQLGRAGLDAAEDWLADRRSEWEQRLDRLDAFLIDQQEQS